MRSWLKWGYHVVSQLGIDGIRVGRVFAGLPIYLWNSLCFLLRWRSAPAVFRFGKPYLCLGDRFEKSGQAKGHYFHQDLWAAQRIFFNRPLKHVDVGSRIDGFVAHVASFRELEVRDIRPLSVRIPNIQFQQLDLMDANAAPVNYCDSLSSLSVLEHLGLGRYGDPLDPAGYLKGWETLYRMLKPGGKFYFSVPIGSQRIEYDAHRVFSVTYLLELIAPKYRLDALQLVNDAGDLITPPARDEAAQARNFDCEFGCGLFELTKYA